MYRILKEEIIPRKLKHIVWDVDGTITKGDIPDKELLDKIVAYANKGVHHSFITGRDRKWLEKVLISSLREVEGFGRVIENFHFYPELGLINLDPVSGKIEVTDLIENHPLTNPSIREKLANLVYQTKNLLPYKGEERPDCFIGGDVDGNFYYIPKKPEVELPWFIWEDGKELMAAFGIIRNLSTRPYKRCAKKLDIAIERLEKFLKDWGLEKEIKPSRVSTAINLVAVVNGLPLDKEVAEGIALYNLAQRLQVSIFEIYSQTIAFGDGMADLRFATPFLGVIPMLFVGPKNQLRPTVLQERMIAVAGEGALEEGKETGPEVTKEILQLIESRIPPKRDVIYIRGKDSFQEFEGTERLARGIEKRIRHSTEEDVQIHDAYLDPAIQEGHVHSAGYEAIMRLEGDIDALTWKEEKAQVYPLKEWGDLIIFLPGTQHTLLVKEKSRIIVAKNFLASPERDQRQHVELPASIESLRQEALEGRKSVKEILEEAKAKL